MTDWAEITELARRVKAHAELLHEQGLKIARRTVAKYREALRLLPARARRRYD